MSTSQHAALPRWAQTELRVLGMRLAEANASIRQLEDAVVASGPTRISMQYSDEAPRPLRDHSEIRFTLPNGGMIGIWLDNEDHLCVTSLAGGLVILPAAANSVTLEVRP